MKKSYISLGLMSGTSGDGVDASIINSNGIDDFEVIQDKYFEYDSNLFKQFHNLKGKIFNINDLKKLNNELKDFERKITLFHAKIIKELERNNEIFLVGFHGQTIYHNPKEKISKQLGDGKLLYQLTKKKIVYDFRKNDILNEGEGAPLTPLFHQLIVEKKKIKLPVCILNIGGISNITFINKMAGVIEIFSKDIGPGNCIIDNWIRKNSNYKFDKDGKLTVSGTINEIILEQAQELFFNSYNKKKISFDTSDFDISFARGLSLEDGAATLTEFTSALISESLSNNLNIIKAHSHIEILVCGGGRKNSILIKKIKEKLPSKYKIKLIEEYELDGDFIESQAFGFLAVRSYLKLPNSFPNTTNCKSPTIGGELIEN